MPDFLVGYLIPTILIVAICLTYLRGHSYSIKFIIIFTFKLIYNYQLFKIKKHEQIFT
jgi:hypothetical protein